MNIIKIVYSMVRTRSFMTISILVFMGFLHAQQDQGRILESSISESITHADTYYWFGMEENGHLGTFRQGLSYLDQADSLLEITGTNGPPFNALAKQSKALRMDLDNQIIRGYDRFTGTFPLINLLGYNFFTGEKRESIAIKPNGESSFLFFSAGI